MLKEAYEQGVLAAFIKQATLLNKLLVNPATIGGVLGAGGSVLADTISGKTPSWKRALGMGAGGALVGLGVRHGSGALTRVAKKFPSLGKHMLTPAGTLSHGFSDLGWMAPSLLAVPALTASSGEESGGAGRAGMFQKKR